MTKEEIFDKNSDILYDIVGDHYSCLDRENGYLSMQEWAKQQAIAFDTWKLENRWFSFENGYWYQTHEQGTAMSEATYNKHHRKTREQLYDLFIEQQNKGKWQNIGGDFLVAYD